MKKFFSLLLGVSLFLQSTLAAFGHFSDVPTTSRYANDIHYLEEQGIIPSSAAVFEPNEAITKSDYARWVLQHAGFKNDAYEPKTRRRFSDVTLESTPHAAYIYRLVDLGVIEIPRTETPLFHPDRPLTRVQALRWLFSVEGVPVPKIFDESQFQAIDILTSSPNAPYVHVAIQKGLLVRGKVYPYSNLTRAQTAHFLKVVRSTVPVLTVNIASTPTRGIQQNAKFDLLATSWDRIFSTYLKRDSVNADKLMYGAIEGMVKELGDKHSGFERPGGTSTLDSLSSEVEGIGAVIQKEKEDIVIVSPISGSPAEGAGLLPGDIITAVDGVSVQGMELIDVVSRIKGKSGTQVTLTIKRGTKTLTFEVTRSVVKITSVTLERTTDNIAIIKLANFGDTTNAEFKTAVSDIASNKPKGIVLDLRNNPGGYLTTAIYISGFFVKKGDKVVQVRYPDQEATEYSQGTAELAGNKIVVLTNGGSASASEILAGALQDYGLATLVGEKTFGKGTVQELAQFNDGSTLKLTVAEWLTPKGRSIEKEGIAPDIEVKLTETDREAGQDPQLDRALVELRK